MDLNYFNLPFGAQLLLWTSRVLLRGSCRTTPNKYELVNIAYNKVGILSGEILLKDFLLQVKEQKSFKLQHISIQKLNMTEINLINCINDYKNKNFDDDYYLDIWNIKSSENHFIIAAQRLALAFKEAKLNIDLNSIYYNRYVSQSENYFSKTFH